MIIVYLHDNHHLNLIIQSLVNLLPKHYIIIAKDLLNLQIIQIELKIRA